MTLSPSATISDYLRIRGRMTRSVSIARDISDSLALDGYILTRRVQETVEQIGGTLRRRDTQRAWRVVGPYGSGKSSLGLLLCHLVQGPRTSQAAFDLVAKYADSLNKNWRPGFGWLPIVISGSRRSIYSCVVDGLLTTLLRIAGAPKRTAIHSLLTQATEKGVAPIKIDALIDAFSSFAVAKGYKGLFFVFDELGKCLEHASIDPDAGDLFALQEIAELTYREEPIPIAIVTLVHQHFEEYARDLSKGVSAEWGKISSRFQEIAFDEPFEQYLALISETLGTDSRLSKALSYIEAAKTRVERIQSSQGQMSSKVIERLEAHCSLLYPLHPACALALPTILKRFAQSERSLFAFLTEETPASLRAFCASRPPTPTTWFDLGNLFDYLSQGMLRFRNAELQRKWEYVLHLLSAGGLTLEEGRLLKVLALLECCGPIGGLNATALVIEAALDLPNGAISEREVARRLVDERVLILRRDTGEIALALDEAVRIDALEHEAIESLAATERQTYGLSKMMGRSAIAHRHYHGTGTLRTFEMRYGVVTGKGVTLAAASSEYDGSIIVLFASPGCDDAQAVKLAGESIGSETSSLVRIFRLDTTHAQRLHELSLWTRVGELARLRNADNWTLRHIERKLDESASVVRRDILMAVESNVAERSAQWSFQKQPVPHSENMNISQMASWLADKLYPSAPKILNEMINRNKLSSQIAMARQRLVELMIQTPSQPFLGIEGFPPERAIYSAVLHSTGIHQPRAGNDQDAFRCPLENDSQQISPFWQKVEAELAKGKTLGVDQILRMLSAPPFGMRLGVSTLLLTSYIMGHRMSLVLFERGTLVFDPTVEHFARLFKAPQNFSLRGLVGHAGQESYLRKLNAGVRLFSNEAGGSNAVALTRALARWNARLSNYSKETTNLSKHAKAVRASILKATDPIALLCEALPKAVEGSIAPEKTAATISSIDQAIDEISVADRELRKDVAEKLGAAFGLRGSLASVRAALCQECKAPTHHAVDYQLKSFVTRCIDPALTDDKWLESVAGLVTHRSMDNWIDATVELFSLEIKRFAAQLRRWIDLMLERGQIVAGAENLVRVAVTDGAGHEFREVFHRDILSTDARQCAIDAIVKVTGVAADDLGPILASLYLQYTDGDLNKNNKEKTNGK